VLRAIRTTSQWSCWTTRSAGSRRPDCPQRDRSRTCRADSGGPNFLGAGAAETNIVAATTITGDFMCRATNVVYRLDTASARWFLGQYVTLP
jgi:hypothetical protein